MKHIVKINQPGGTGDTIISFDKENMARATVDFLNLSGDPRTTAVYVGQAEPTHWAFIVPLDLDRDFLRAKALESYEFSTNRRALDAHSIHPLGEGTYQCQILAGSAITKAA